MALFMFSYLVCVFRLFYRWSSPLARVHTSVRESEVWGKALGCMTAVGGLEEPYRDVQWAVDITSMKTPSDSPAPGRLLASYFGGGAENPTLAMLMFSCSWWGLVACAFHCLKKAIYFWERGWVHVMMQFSHGELEVQIIFACKYRGVLKSEPWLICLWRAEAIRFGL